MVIYHAVSFYQLLTCVVHSCTQKDKNKVMVLGANVERMLHSSQQLRKFFDKVIYIDINRGFQNPDTVKEEVTKYLKKFLMWKNL